MDLEVAKQIIESHMMGHAQMISDSLIAERYYENQNDVLFSKAQKDEEEDTPLRNADNRISHGFYRLLVKQKASYAFTRPPVFDVGNKANNKKVSDVLGGKFSKICKKICINASNSGVAWIHYWKGKTGEFHYAVVDTKQIVPVFTDDLEEELCAVLRAYTKRLEDGKLYDIYEIWNDKECAYYQKEVGEEFAQLREYKWLTLYSCYDGAMDMTNTFSHDFERVPFIRFQNNDTAASDLKSIKDLIDSYDKVYSGFVNDLEDIQQVIFILSGYEGEDLGEFLTNLKKYKTVKLEAEENNGLSTLSIQIPIEAREKLLEITRKNIFEQGQGLDPQREDFGNQSGVALKFLYSLLELKVGDMETEFRESFEELVRAICKHVSISVTDVTQQWKRTNVANDMELVDMCLKSQNVISKDTIVRNHPFVENPEKELKQIKKEQEEAEQMYDSSFGADGDEGNNNKDGDIDETEPEE